MALKKCLEGRQIGVVAADGDGGFNAGRLYAGDDLVEVIGKGAVGEVAVCVDEAHGEKN